jgi:hypothetical protein
MQKLLGFPRYRSHRQLHPSPWLFTRPGQLDPDQDDALLSGHEVAGGQFVRTGKTHIFIGLGMEETRP